MHNLLTYMYMYILEIYMYISWSLNTNIILNILIHEEYDWVRVFIDNCCKVKS